MNQLPPPSSYPAAELLSYVPLLAGRRVLVIGDLFLDEYIEGQATRLSREAPIPVLEFERRFWRPGGAANPAHNVVSLGGHAYQVGVVGDDEAGRQLLHELTQVDIDASGVAVDAGRPTTTKTRIISRGSLRYPQQVARIDRVDRRPIDGGVLAALQEHIARLAEGVDAVLMSDYRSGVAVKPVIAAALRAAQAAGRPIAVDSQGNLALYKGFDLIKCNQSEAEATLRRDLTTSRQVEEACEDLLEAYHACAVVITRGPNGMAGLSAGGPFVLLPAADSPTTAQWPTTAPAASWWRCRACAPPGRRRSSPGAATPRRGCRPPAVRGLLRRPVRRRSCRRL